MSLLLLKGKMIFYWHFNNAKFSCASRSLLGEFFGFNKYQQIQIIINKKRKIMEIIIIIIYIEWLRRVGGGDDHGDVFGVVVVGVVEVES